MNIHTNQRQPPLLHSNRLFVGVLLVTLILCLGSVSGGGTSKTAQVTAVGPKKCIVCDSREHPECANYTFISQLPPAHPFEQECKGPGNETWCYWAGGKIYTMGYEGKHLKKLKLHKVDLGCTRKHDKPLCHRITQEDGWTNFLICHCTGEYCNKNSSIMNFNISHTNTAGKPVNFWGFAAQYALFLMILFLGF